VKLKLLEETGSPDLATVFVASLEDSELVEFVESVQPPVPREEKLVFIVSTLRGCPAGCPICDAGIRYGGRLSADEILEQIDYLVRRRFPDRTIPVPKLKIQFARMGDPAFNPAVIDVLHRLPAAYRAPGLMPCISTIAPKGAGGFFGDLMEVKEKHYRNGRFQMQFSLHTTSETRKIDLIPVPTWTFAEMSEWGEGFVGPGDRKIALNFAPVDGYPLEPEAVSSSFSPDVFLVKLTPVNPTRSATLRGIRGSIDPHRPARAEAVAESFRNAGFETILSIGELRENSIGSNCGMFVSDISGRC
jgi:23S rRNA (adenine2503-C2)-methyltransferase